MPSFRGRGGRGRGRGGRNDFRNDFNEDTGKFLSEALIFASINPQYDDRLFIELQVQYMKTTGSEYVVDINCFFVFILIFKAIYVHNMFSTCSKLVLFMY